MNLAFWFEATINQNTTDKPTVHVCLKTNGTNYYELKIF